MIICYSLYYNYIFIQIIKEKWINFLSSKHVYKFWSPINYVNGHSTTILVKKLMLSYFPHYLLIFIYLFICLLADFAHMDLDGGDSGSSPVNINDFKNGFHVKALNIYFSCQIKWLNIFWRKFFFWARCFFGQKLKGL